MQLKVVKIPHQKNSEAWAVNVTNMHRNLLSSTGLLFRGVNINILEHSIKIPLLVINTNNFDYQFGTAVYVTPNLAYAKKFAGVHGTVLVYHETNNRSLRVRMDNEFGSVIYVVPNLAYAKEFAGVSGAVLVYHETDNRSLNVWTP